MVKIKAYSKPCQTSEMALYAKTLMTDRLFTKNNQTLLISSFKGCFCRTLNQTNRKETIGSYYQKSLNLVSQSLLKVTVNKKSHPEVILEEDAKIHIETPIIEITTVFLRISQAFSEQLQRRT